MGAMFALRQGAMKNIERSRKGRTEIKQWNAGSASNAEELGGA